MADTPDAPPFWTEADVLHSADDLIARRRPPAQNIPAAGDPDAASVPTLTDLVDLPDDAPAATLLHVQVDVQEAAPEDVPLPTVDLEALDTALPPPVETIREPGPTPAALMEPPPPLAEPADPPDAHEFLGQATSSGIRSSLARQLEEEVLARVQSRLEEAVDALIERKLMPELAAALARSVDDAGGELRVEVRQMVRAAIGEMLDERGRGGGTNL
jgi:hypothetical protein